MSIDIDDASVKAFQDKIMSWWRTNSRDLPWRNNPSPYNVLVSEVMLQQTQVSRVIPKYNEFLNAFPTLESLANAETRHLLKTWSGLGYNRRALWLREAARDIINRGSFPENEKELRELKGIGRYTSRSILIFAFNKDIATIDTNIRRVIIASGFATEESTQSELEKIADLLLPVGRSSDWHNALMDYGSHVLTTSSTGIAPLSSQTKFAGSSRQIRGIIIRLLTENSKVTLSEISHEINQCVSENYDIFGILKQLMQEKLIVKIDSDEYAIAP
ncbi:MAG: Fe-S cluster assembly protein HesB [Candidatus Thorarchaeota archaeon]